MFGHGYRYDEYDEYGYDYTSDTEPYEQDYDIGFGSGISAGLFAEIMEEEFD